MFRPSAVLLLPALISAPVLAHAQAAPAVDTLVAPEAAAVDAGPRELLVPEYPASSARTSLAWTGVGLFAGWYGAAVGSSFLWSNTPGIEKLRIPVAGPWLALADVRCAANDSGCTDLLLVLRAALMLVDGVGQLSGIAVLGEAAFLPTSRRAERAVAPRPELRATPFVAGRDGLGLSVSGAF